MSFGLEPLFNAKLVALLTEKDLMLSPIVKALQDEVDKVSAKLSLSKTSLIEIFINPIDHYSWTQN